MSQADSTVAVHVPPIASATMVQAQTEITEVGPYKIVRKIGQGAMGAVYLAEHANLGRNVALKILPPEFADDPVRLERFQREMTAIGKLEHENIVLATDAGKSDGYFYIAMQYVDGCDLEALLSQVNRFETQAACEIVRQAALGLQHIHDCNLVHRDIKPSNIVVTAEGTVKILDLGIARLRQDDNVDAAFTAADALMGTPDYMAPEQIHQCSEVDIRADIYSLGCTLYTLLSGQVPFEGPQYNNHAAKLVAHAEHQPESLSQLCPDLPDRLVELVERMMAKSPNDRPSTPAEVASELTPWSSTTNLTVLMAGNAPQLPSARSISPANRWRSQRSNSVLSKPALLWGAAVLTTVLCLLGYVVPKLVAGSNATTTHTAAIARSTESIDHHTQNMAQSLDALRARFAGFNAQSAIAVPQSPGDYYYNARVYGEKGDYQSARQAFLRYFQHELDVIDPHLHFIRFLKLQEGLAGAREVYGGLPGDQSLVSRRFAMALLQDPAARKQQLLQLTEEEFAPAYFELSRASLTAQPGPSSLEEQRHEQRWLMQYLELHDRGQLVRYYLDQTGAVENVALARQRLAALQHGRAPLDEPVRFSFLPLGKEWRVDAYVAEACREILYRVGDTGEFQSTGTFQFGQVDPRTGHKPPNSNFTVADTSEPITIAVKYIDVNGVEQGPYTNDFDPVTHRRDFAIATLKQNPNGWLRLHADGTLYFDLLFQWAGIAEFHYGIDEEVPSLTRPVPTADMNSTNAKMFHGINVPETTQFVSVQVKFTDGTTSDVVKIKRLDR